MLREREHLIRSLFNEYIEMYASRDDRLTARFSENFSGYTGGGDFLVKDRNEWKKITRQDFAQVTSRIRIEMLDLSLQDIADDVVVATALFHIHLPIPDHILSREKVRLVLIFRLENEDWKIVHSGISVPYGLVGDGEVYPIKGLHERNRELEALVEERTVELRAREERFQKLFDGASDGIVIMSPGGMIISANEAYARMHGYSVDEMHNMNVRDLDTPEASRLATARIQRVLAGEMVSFEVEHYHKDGHVFPQEVSASLIQAGGEPLIQSFHRDVTERKRTEAERARLEAQLRESQKMEALGTLAGGVAHDFNNALAMILGNVELARQDVGPDHAASVSLEEIGKASRRAKDLVQQILAFGRRQSLELKPTSLALVVVESERLLRATMPAGVSLSVDCEPNTPAVTADATQVKQILLNLYSNALYAVQGQGRPGLIEVRLHAYTKDEASGDLMPGRYACLTVRDNGPGMDETTRSRIFEPFFTTKPKGKGTGLGLSVVHGIVKAHEASVEVKSAPGEGTEFRICFPAIDAPVPNIVMPFKDIAPVRGKGKHILYVDDEEAIIFLMKRLLERQGYRVSGYTAPEEALAAARANPEQFDLAVTDYNMPGMSGLEVASALREIRADLPVVLASGYITEELRQMAPAAGVRELIYKSDTVDDLCEAVARCANAQSKIAS